MSVAQTKMFFRVSFILVLICFVVSLCLSWTKEYGFFSKTFSVALGIICFLVAINHKKTMGAEVIPGGADFLYAISFVAGIAYLIFLFFNVARYVISHL